MRAAQAGATAAKVCGAGGGGCLFCYGPPERRGDIEAALAAGGARLLDYRFEQHGLTRG
jgi:D-glycero-alpha-D-manno-heptose-7-phosphate kinase